MPQWARTKNQKVPLTFSDVEVEKVTVEYCLHAASNHSYQVKESLEVEAVDPVENVESAVGAEGKQVVAGDGLCLPRLADHEQLRQNGHRFQVDGEGPQDLEQPKEATDTGSTVMGSFFSQQYHFLLPCRVYYSTILQHYPIPQDE